MNGIADQESGHLREEQPRDEIGRRRAHRYRGPYTNGQVRPDNSINWECRTSISPMCLTQLLFKMTSTFMAVFHYKGQLLTRPTHRDYHFGLNLTTSA